MKSLKPVLLGSFSVAIGTILPGCVAPYPASPGPAHTATTYSVGYEVRTLPSGYRTEIVGGTQYYIHNNTYYRPRSGRYVVVQAPRGYHAGPREVYIDRLPPGYRVVRRGGQRYYYANNRYYQQRGTRYIAVEISTH